MTIFKPDSKLVAGVVPSPNHGARKATARPDMIVLHYTGMESADAALEQLCDRKAEVSSHYFVFEDGRIFQLVPEKRRAWHAGVSSWDGESDVNSRSIGIEIVNPGHDYGYPGFPARQIEAVIALCRDIIRRQRVRADRVLAHSDVAPARKSDPGENFPWRRLAQSGVGLWVRPAAIRPGSVLKAGHRGEAVCELQQALAAYGYGIAETGVYDPATRNIVAAFQRHFRPAGIDGIADQSTLATLRALGEARAELG
jgi:N-acetylmuramoyl-L-alanine amidase